MPPISVPGFNLAALRQLRLERGFSLAKMAVLVGVQPETIRNWERGAHSPGPQRARAIAQALSVDIKEILSSSSLTLADFRALAGTTQNQAAEELGIPGSLLSAFEQGVIPPPEMLLMKMAKIYEISEQEVHQAAEETLRQGPEESLET